MLVTLIRRYSKPYLPYIGAVIFFQLASTIAALYLPSLNAQIIDEGVSRGDTDYIWRTGGVMLGVALVQVATAIAGVYFGSKAAMAFGRDLRRGVFRKVTSFSAKDVNVFGAPTLITRGTNDVQQVQMLMLMGAELHGGHAHHVHRRHHHGPPRGPQPVLAGLGVRAGARRRGGLPRGPPDAAVPVHADEDRPAQRRPPRADHRHPRGPGLRPRTPRGRALRRRQQGPHRRLAENRRPVRADVPGHRHDPARLHRRRAVVRRPAGRRRRDAGRRADGLPAVPAADPDGRHDGHLHGHDDSARLGLRGPHRRGARRRTLHPRGTHPRGAGCRRPAASNSGTCPSPTPAPKRRC